MAKTKKLVPAPPRGFTGEVAVRMQVGPGRLRRVARRYLERGFDESDSVSPDERAIIYECNAHTVFMKPRSRGNVLRQDRSDELFVESFGRALKALILQAKSGAWPSEVFVAGCRLVMQAAHSDVEIADDSRGWYSHSSGCKAPLTYKDVSKKPVVVGRKSLPEDVLLLAVFPARNTELQNTVTSEAVATQFKTDILRFASTRLMLAHHFEELLRGFDGLEPKTTSEGQEIAKQVNDMLAAHGCQLVFPGTDASAILVFLANRADGAGAFCLKGRMPGMATPTSKSLTRHVAELNKYVADFSQLQVRPIPIGDYLSSPRS